MQEEKELEECSFKPTLSYSSKVYMEKILRKKDMHSVDQLVNSFLEESQ